MKPLLANLVIAGTLLQLPLAVVVIGKRLWRSLPIFAAYSLTSALSLGILYGVGKALPMSRAHFYTYCISEGIAMVLGFGVVYEVFGEILKPYDALKRVAAATGRWVLGGLIVLGLVVLVAQPSGDKSPLASAVLITEEVSRIVEVGLLAFLFLFSRAFGLHWRQNIFGIALGLGVFAGVELAGLALRATLGPMANQGFNLARALSFNVSLLIWLGYIMAPERITSTAELPQRAQLEQWNQAIMELINQ
jgi:hypothetical protein